MNDTHLPLLEKAECPVPCLHTGGPQSEGAGARGGPGACAGFWLHMGAGARAPRPSLAFEAQCSSLLLQLITRNNGAQPCPLTAPESVGWEGEVNGCLFVYGHRRLYWFLHSSLF